MAVARTMLLRLQADASQYTKTMQMATKEQQILRKELDLWSVQSKKAVGSATYLKKELEMQKQQQQLLQVQVKKTTAELDTQAKKYGEDSRQAQNLRGRLVDLQLQQEKLNKSIKDAPKQIFKQQTAQIGGAIKNVGIGATAAITAPIVATGTGIYKTGEMYEQSYNTIRSKTGSSSGQFQQLKSDFKEVYASVSSGADVVSSAVAQLYQRTNLTSTALQELAKSELRFAKLTGSDVNETIRSSTRLFGDWSIPVAEQTKTLDKLYKVTQLTGVSSQQLMEQLVYFGAPLRSMGINFGEAAALIGKFEKEGVNAELVLTSMRRAAVNMSKAGVKDIAGGFVGSIQNIKNAPNDAEAMKTAIDIFGARSANDMMRAIRENRFELTELFKALNDNSDSLSLAAADVATAGSQFEKLKHQIQNAIEPLGISFVEAVKASMPMIKAGAERLRALLDSFVALPDATKSGIIGIVMFAAVIGPMLTSLGYMVIGLGALPGIFATVQVAITATIGFIKTAVLAFQMWQFGLYTFGEAALAVMGPAGWIALGIGVVIALTAAIWQNKQAQGDLSAEYIKQSQQAEQNRKQADDLANAQLGQVYLVERLIPELESLSNNTRKSVVEKQRMQQIVSQLNQVIPNLSLEINNETGALSKQVSVVYDAISAYKQLILVKASEKKAEAAASRLLDAQKKIDGENSKSREMSYTPNGVPVFYSASTDYNSVVKENQRIVDDANKEIEDAYNIRKQYNDKFGNSTYKPENTYKPAFSGSNIAPVDIGNSFADKNNKVADAIKNVRDAVVSYMEKLKQATDTTQQFVGLFDRFERKTISLSRLIKNMSINRDVMISWQGNISTLQNNGLDSAFLQELIKKGVSGYNEAKALAKSTPEQIAQLNSLWADQRWNAGNVATMQLSNDPVITRQTVNQTVKVDIHGNEIRDENDIDSLVDRIVEALSRKGVLVNG